MEVDQEILGGQYGIKDVTIDLENNDIINISSLIDDTFNPTN